jgi:hypothetical protein
MLIASMEGGEKTKEKDSHVKESCDTAIATTVATTEIGHTKMKDQITSKVKARLDRKEKDAAQADKVEKGQTLTHAAIAKFLVTTLETVGRDKTMRKARQHQQLQKETMK